MSIIINILTELLKLYFIYACAVLIATAFLIGIILKNNDNVLDRHPILYLLYSIIFGIVVSIFIYNSIVYK